MARGDNDQRIELAPEGLPSRDGREIVDAHGRRVLINLQRAVFDKNGDAVRDPPGIPLAWDPEARAWRIT